MNILVITPIYPGPGISDNYTKVIHYFVKEWIKMGENVKVISIPSYFPKLFYHFPKFIISLLQKLFNATIPISRNTKIETYEIEDVAVTRVPLYKLHPWAKISNRVLQTAAKSIIEDIKKNNFNPDLVIGHWFDPTIYFLDYLKQYYHCKTSLVIHNHSFKYSNYIDAPDILGCRKVSTYDVIKSKFPTKKVSFRCYSGIPEVFLEAPPKRSWTNISRFIYIGTLIPRKYPDVIIEALMKSDLNEFKLSIIGEGVLRDKLYKKISDYNLQDKVTLYGRVDRTKIIKELDNSDVFIMISKDEVFGLVYIEAMARGCIVIASEKEGMEGIIKNGYNGFLIPAGNEVKLKETINHISHMTVEERMQMSKYAQQTATELTDKKVAMKYLNNLKERIL